MTNRDLVMLAKTYDPTMHGLCGMMFSEKLDGIRALWLPWTRGLGIEDVEFANRERDTRDHVCTGLWSRYGKVIHAPLWFTGNLPGIPLDGELWLGRGQFQELVSITKRLEPDARWGKVQYKVFDCPDYRAVYREGRIYGPNYSHVFPGQWPVGLREAVHPAYESIIGSAERVYHGLKKYFPALDTHEQTMLPFSQQRALAMLEEKMKEILAAGGEGGMLRNPSHVWEPKRTHGLVKIKPHHDDEAVIVGHTAGKGKYTGMLGALIVTTKSGVRLELSGMSDEERKNPPPIGAIVTYRYRELSVAGVPKDARYLRIREKE